MLKKVMAGALAACMVVSTTAVVSASTGRAGFSYNDAYPTAAIGSTVSTWIPVYSDSYNMGPDLDTNTFRECADNLRLHTNEVVDVTKQPTYHPDDATNSKFLVDTTGIIQPDTTKTAGIVWKAPQAGTYYVDVIITGGTYSNEGVTNFSNTDGLTASIFKNNTNIYSRNFDKFKETVAVPRLTVTVNAGDDLFFVADPKVSGDHDTSEWKINIQSAEIWHIGESVEYPDKTASATAQGVNGWYYMSSPKFNQGENFDVITISQCYQVSAGHWVPYSRLSDASYFQDNGSEDSMLANRTLYDANSIFEIDNTGIATPGGDQTAVIAWQAPADGYYEVDANVNAGSTGGDGVTVSVYNSYVLLASKNMTGGVSAANVVDALLYLKKGQIVYFIADQNKTQVGDYCEWDILINRSTPDTMNYIFGMVDPSPVGTDGLYHSYDGTGVVAGGVNSGKVLTGGTQLYPLGTANLISGRLPQVIARADEYNAALLESAKIQLEKNANLDASASNADGTVLGGTTTATVNASALNVRSSASSTSTKLGSLPRGTVVTVIGTDRNWSQISYNGGTAYVYTSYLTF